MTSLRNKLHCHTEMLSLLFFITNYFQLSTSNCTHQRFIVAYEQLRRHEEARSCKLHSTDTPGSWLEPQGLQGCPPVDTPFLQGNSYTHRHLFSTFNMCAISYTLLGIYTVTSYNLIIQKVKKKEKYFIICITWKFYAYILFIHSLSWVNEYKKRDW